MSEELGWCKDVTRCIDKNKGLAYHIAGRYRSVAEGLGETWNDLTQEALRALGDACRGYKHGQGEFSTYAWRAIETAIFTLLGSSQRAGNIHDSIERLRQQYERNPTPEEVAVEAEVPLEAVTEYLARVQPHISIDSLGPGGEDEAVLLDVPVHPTGDAGMKRLELDEYRDVLEKAICSAGLTDDEERVLRLRWGLDQDRRPRPRAQVAAILAKSLSGRPSTTTGVKTRKRGSQPKLNKDTIRILELRATAKVEAALGKG